MIVSLFLFVGIMLLSIVLTYTIVSIMSSDKINSEAAMDALIQTNISLIVTTVVESVSDTISIVTTKFFEYLVFFVSSNFKCFKHYLRYMVSNCA